MRTIMFTDFIKQILGAERRSTPNRLEMKLRQVLSQEKTAKNLSLKNTRKTLPLWKKDSASFLLKLVSLSTLAYVKPCF